jgi:hypothetical protein
LNSVLDKLIEDSGDFDGWGTNISEIMESKTGFPLGFVPESESRSITPIRQSSQRKAKNCKKGKPCGGSCQSKKNVCFVGLSADQKSLALKARAAMKSGPGGIASELPSSTTTDSKSKIASELHDFYDFVKGTGSISAEEQEIMKDIIKFKEANPTFYQNLKIKKLKKGGMTSEESFAFEGYIGGEYRGMNEILYNSSAFQNGEWSRNSLNFQRQMAVNKYAAAGLKKLPPTTIDDINKLESDFFGSSSYTADKPLIRHETIPKAILSNHIEKHRQAIENGEPLTKEQFFSTTFNQKGLDYFAEDANVEYRIKAKLDGSGSGRLVDAYKNQAFESEVLYPPMTQFKVTKLIERPGQPAKTEKVKTTTYLDSKPKAQDIALNLLEEAKISDSLGAGGFNKTTIAIKLKQKADLVSFLNTDTSTELEKIADSIGKQKAGKKALNDFIEKTKSELSKAPSTTEEKEILISPSKPATFIIEMEEF